jgi:hypothetical protein
LNSIHTKIHHSGTSFGPTWVKLVSIIRWEGRITPVRALRKWLPRIINILNESQATNNDGNEISECGSPCLTLSNPHSFFSWEYGKMSWIYSALTVSTCRKKDCDILTETSILRSTITAIEEIRTSEYKVFLKTATDIANLLDIPGQFPEFESERKSQCQVKLLKTNS